MQFVVGFFSFLLLLCCESATASFRAALVPIHSTFGITTFVMAVATACSGLTEKAFFTLRYVFLHTNVFQDREKKKYVQKKKNACFSSNYLLEACWKKTFFQILKIWPILLEECVFSKDFVAHARYALLIKKKKGILVVFFWIKSFFPLH